MKLRIAIFLAACGQRQVRRVERVGLGEQRQIHKLWGDNFLRVARGG